MTQECAEYRALYEKMVLPPNMGPRVDWARVLEQKQVRVIPSVGTPQGAGSHTQQASEQYCVIRGLTVCLDLEVVRSLKRERARGQYSQGRLPARGGSEASERWKSVAGWGEMVRRGHSRKKEQRLLPEEAWV